MTSLLFQSVLRGMALCIEHDSEEDPLVMTYKKINSFEIEFNNSLGEALTKYFEDKQVLNFCEKCCRETKHEQEDLELMISSTILSFSLPRFNDLERNKARFCYPKVIEFMNRFSSDYQPSYELFAVIANRGDSLF